MGGPTVRWFSCVLEDINEREKAGNEYKNVIEEFLDMSEKLLKAAASFIMSVCLSVHPRGTT